MAESANNRTNTNGTSVPQPAVVSTKVVSPKGARVTEQVIVLSDRAAARLEIKGHVPAR